MKRFLSFAAMLFVLASLVIIPVMAEDGFQSEYSRLSDSAGLLDDGQRENILSALDEISVRQKFDVVIVTLESLGDYDSAMECADDYYDYGGFGYGADHDGVLLLISMEERDYWISTCGYGIKAFTDRNIDYLKEQIQPYLSSGDYYEAFNEFISWTDIYVDDARNGTSSYDDSDIPLSPLWFVIAFIVGMIISGITVAGMKGRLRSVRPKFRADSYVRDGSLRVASSRDMFLYSSVSRTAKPEPESSSGGSSTHTSSSGTTHGGGGGKF